MEIALLILILLAMPIALLKKFQYIPAGLPRTTVLAGSRETALSATTQRIRRCINPFFRGAALAAPH